MKYTTRQDFAAELPAEKTQYCWHCGTPGAEKTGNDPVEYACGTCGKTSGRVLIYDPNMQMHFDGEGRLVHESCGVIITRADGKLLLFKRTKFPYMLTIPAGHLETGENPLDCAIRETREEIGLDIPEPAELYVGDIGGDSCLGGADIHHWYAYGCRVDDTAEVSLDEEGSGWGWYDVAELTEKNTVRPLLYLLEQPGIVEKLAVL